ncbi:unknown protein [Seminavis robusta]|uniref:Uncharacterized protein n=1 Tax=Seminavis robusta TaxID=568900 RepID=A0A9N8HBT2_9STRA|nr:unknown protein [Seminavis robusta]|eukprot:Sro377_g129960.1 n/a (254) ;mRNA; r:12801-13681
MWVNKIIKPSAAAAATMKGNLVYCIWIALSLVTWSAIAVHLALSFGIFSLKSVHAILTGLIRLIDGGFGLRKRVVVLSPSPKKRAPHPVTNTREQHLWSRVLDIDGLPSGRIGNVSFRIKLFDGRRAHYQGDLQLERFGSTMLHRLRYSVFETLTDELGSSFPGDKRDGCLYLPLDGRVKMKDLYGKSKRKSMKVLSLMADYDYNCDNLACIQITIEMGHRAEYMSAALRFQTDLETAVMGGNDAEEDLEHAE